MGYNGDVPATVDDLDPPAFLRLVGHPLRWRLLDGLADSDRTVHELTAAVAEPQNLVSYHLGQLRSARLVSSRRSSADRRDAYYSLDVARIGWMLAATGGSLHPGLRLAPAPLSLQTEGRRPRVLFLCTGNSARSQMAEALTEARSGGLVEARSAGSHPKALHPLAVRAMREVHGLDIADRRPKHLDEVLDEPFDRVVTLCDKVREVCPELPGRPTAAHWSVADPAAEPGESGPPLAAFLDTATALDARIGFLLATLASPAPTTIPGGTP
jgi:protein-tyrosine-phosphatase